MPTTAVSFDPIGQVENGLPFGTPGETLRASESRIILNAGGGPRARGPGESSPASWWSFTSIGPRVGTFFNTLGETPPGPNGEYSRCEAPGAQTASACPRSICWKSKEMSYGSRGWTPRMELQYWI